VMATEGAAHTDKDHVWHMSTISSFVQEGDGLLMRTPCQVVEFANQASEAAARVGEPDGDGRRGCCRQAIAVRGDHVSWPAAARGEVPRP
jgi:hypothetical protein